MTEVSEPRGSTGFAEVSRARLGRDQAREMLDYVWTPYADLDERNLMLMIDCNEAHTVMLAEQGLLRPAEAASILHALEALRTEPSRLHFDPVRGDLFFNVESFVIGASGEDAGGKMHIGRSRIDLIAALMRLRTLENLLGLLDATFELRGIVLHRAEEGTDCIMQAYTHLQPAQITTFGHYIAAFYDATSRCMQRLTAAYATTNASPLGSAATSGTSWPIDRERVAGLLGFSRVVENTKDAGHNFDWLLEAVGAASILMNDVGRLAWDLYIWCTHEFGMVRLDGSVSASSSIMPQKQNPYSLEMIRGRSAEVGATFTAIYDVLKGDTGGTAFDVKLVGPRIADTAIGRTTDMVRLTTQVVRTLILNRERMARAAGDGFSTAVELADMMVRSHGVSFRTAHLITGNLVRLAQERNVAFGDVDAALVEEAAVTVVGRKLGFTDEAVQAALDPVAFVAARDSAGGPGQGEVRRMLAARRDARVEEEARLRAMHADLERAHDDLATSVAAHA